MKFPNFNNEDGTPKSFWERSEGSWGIGTLAVLGLAGFFSVKYALPSIIEFLGMAISALGKGIVLGAMVAGVAGLYAIVSNNTIQNIVGYAFKNGVRTFANWFVTIDPIGILRSYIDHLKGQLCEIDAGIAKMNGQITILKRKIASNIAGAETALMTAKVAKEQGKNSAVQVNSRQYGRLEKSTVTLKGLLATMELHLRAMRTYREVSDTVIQDMQNEVELRADERKMIEASYSVVKSAKRILNGDPDKKELFDMAMDFVVTDAGQKLGEIEDFIQTSKSFIDGLDLQNGVYEAEALAKIEEWENKANSILLGDGKRQMVENSQINRIQEIAPETANSTAEYNKYFGKN